MRSIACAVFFAAVVSVMPQALAMPRYGFVVLVEQNPESNVTISNPTGLGAAGRMYECLSFKNTSDKSIAHARFVFFYFNKARQLTGSDILDRGGPFPAGAKLDGPEPGWRPDPTKFPNCQEFKIPQGGLEYCVVAVARVEYVDGTVWADATPAPSPTSSGSPGLAK